MNDELPKEMISAYRDAYGGPDVLYSKALPVPQPKPDEILVRVRATSLNASDNEFLTGSPVYTRASGLFTPKIRVLGSDIAGTVVGQGEDVSGFSVGDRVLGDIFDRWGGLADYVAAPATWFAPIPDKLSFVDAAAIPQAAAIALQSLRCHRPVVAGERVLINGAGGGAGTFAVQFAKQQKAHVTAVDKADKLAFLASLGADECLDYAKTDFARTGATYDRIVDLVATRSMRAISPAIAPGGMYLMVGGGVRELLSGFVMGSIRTRFSDKKIGILAVKKSVDDLINTTRAIVGGEIRPAIHNRWDLSEINTAFKLLGNGNIYGKVVITFGDT